jgi:signal transduction histidine kinase
MTNINTMSPLTKTHFASADRAETKEILSDAELIKSEKNLKTILNSLPTVVLILNHDRQIVFGNDAYFHGYNEEAYVQKLGLRPGELLGCIHSIEEPAGCGTSESCRFCGAVSVVLESQKKDKKVSKEARLTTEVDHELKAFDFNITASPLTIRDKNFTLVALEDISHLKRKEALERIFFHDLLNKAGSLNCFCENLTIHAKSEKSERVIEIAANLSAEIVEEINAHRSILEAENGDLKVAKTKVLSKLLLENVIRQISFHTVSYEKHITIHPDTENIALFTDYYLLSRVIMNMLKNALEATSREGKVVISCNRIDDSIRFWVHNERYMEDDTIHQVFQRSFSTKGSNRGLGTYSMKLLGENYLGGKISFESASDKGTTFYFDLPLSTHLIK